MKSFIWKHNNINHMAIQLDLGAKKNIEKK